MYIQPINNNVNMYGKGNDPKFFNRIKQKILDMIPEHTIKDGARKCDKWVKIDEFLSRPDGNRLVMGASAIVTQPVIDSMNRKVDEETRQVSICRTIAKIIAGTTVGILVRGSAYKLVKNMTNLKGTSKWQKMLLPKGYLMDMFKEAKFLNNYRSALSTGLAILAMCITNFVLDAPLTAFLTNYFNDNRLERKKLKEKGGLKNG